MGVETREIPPGLSGRDGYRRLRDLLANVGYSEQAISESLHLDNVRAISGGDLPLLLRATDEPNALNALIRLFLIGVAVPATAVEAAISPMSVQEWIDAGLVRIEDESVFAVLQLLPFREMTIAFDMPRRHVARLSPNYVMGIGSSTLTLDNLTVRRHSRRTLDLGTGCGLLALRATLHSDRVIAVDTNPRAVQVALFNARLNNLANVECLEGNLFEPVREQRFDLIVSNPPFVISPERRYIYRDGGMHGDALTQEIVRQAPTYLEEGGYCQILCNWAHLDGRDWQERLAGWFEGSGCDAWVMRTDTLDAAGYAAKWIRHTEKDNAEQFSRRFQQWTEYYRQEQIEAVSGGLITMRRRDAPSNWYRADDGPERMLGPAGDGIMRCFQLRDFLQANPDRRQWLDRCFQISADARMRQDLAPSPDGWFPTESNLHIEQGLAYSGSMDPYMAELLVRCNGKRRLGTLIGELAEQIGKSASELEPACLDVVHRLIERGFLLPQGDGGADSS